MATAKEVAEWMAGEFVNTGELYQADAAASIADKFGEEHIYYNEHGNPAINSDVLKEFKKLTPTAVWVRAGRYWRSRDIGDEPGRQQAY